MSSSAHPRRCATGRLLRIRTTRTAIDDGDRFAGAQSLQHNLSCRLIATEEPTTSSAGALGEHGVLACLYVRRARTRQYTTSGFEAGRTCGQCRGTGPEIGDIAPSSSTSPSGFTRNSSSQGAPGSRFARPGAHPGFLRFLILPAVQAHNTERSPRSASRRSFQRGRASPSTFLRNHAAHGTQVLQLGERIVGAVRFGAAHAAPTHVRARPVALAGGVIVAEFW